MALTPVCSHFATALFAARNALFADRNALFTARKFRTIPDMSGRLLSARIQRVDYDVSYYTPWMLLNGLDKLGPSLKGTGQPGP